MRRRPPRECSAHGIATSGFAVDDRHLGRHETRERIEAGHRWIRTHDRRAVQQSAAVGLRRRRDLEVPLARGIARVRERADKGIGQRPRRDPGGARHPGGESPESPVADDDRVGARNPSIADGSAAALLALLMPGKGSTRFVAKSARSTSPSSGASSAQRSSLRGDAAATETTGMTRVSGVGATATSGGGGLGGLHAPASSMTAIRARFRMSVGNTMFGRSDHCPRA